MSDRDVEVRVFPRDQTWDQVVLHDRIRLGGRAAFAMELMKLAMIQPCVPDGEDTSGQRQYRMLTEEEVVSRATRISELAFVEFATRQWSDRAPPFADLVKDHGGGMGFSARLNGA